jgi:hypothetical protein
MKYLNIFSFAVFVILYSSQIYSQTEKWVWFCEDDGNNMYYDSNSIDRKTDYTVLWVKSISNKDLYVNGARIDYEMTYCELLCSEKKLRILARYMHSKDYKNSPIKVPVDKDDYDVNSGPVLKTLYNRICVE